MASGYLIAAGVVGILIMIVARKWVCYPRLWSTADLTERSGQKAALWGLGITCLVFFLTSFSANRPDSTTGIPFGLTLAAWIGAAVVSPILNEWMIRGMIQMALLQHVPWYVAIMLTAGTWALLNWGTPWPAFVLGLTWGYIAYRRKALTIPILLNTTFVTLTWLFYR